MIYLLSLFLLSLSVDSAVIVKEENIAEFLEKSPDLLSFRERLNAAEKLKGSLTRSFLPELKLTYGREKFTTGPYHGLNQPFGGIEAEVNLYNSGRDAIENSIRNKNSEVSGIDYDVVKAKITSESRVALAHLAYLKEVLSIIENAITINNQNISGARKRINAGLATNTDIIDFNQQKLSLIQEFETIKYEDGVIRRMLAILLGINPNEKIQIVHSNSHPEHHQLPEPVISSRDSKLIKKAELMSDIARLESKSAQRWWAPKLDIYSYALRFTQKEREFEDPEDRNDFTVGFKFTLPLFDGGESIQEARARSALARANESQLKQRALEVEKETIDAMKKLELAHTLIHTAEESVKLMTDYRQAVIREYAKGIKNSPDVLQATQRWIEAKIKLAEVKKNFQIAGAEAWYLKSLTN